MSFVLDAPDYPIGDPEPDPQHSASADGVWSDDEEEEGWPRSSCKGAVAVWAEAESLSGGGRKREYGRLDG
jgi:hypothetical protein